MANRLKLKGTTEKSFDVGLTNKQTFDTTALTSNLTWVLPANSGALSDVLATDGTGNLRWVPQSGGSGQVGVPYFLPSASTFTVPQYNQALFTLPIDIEGTMIIDGILVEVN